MRQVWNGRLDGEDDGSIQLPARWVWLGERWLFVLAAGLVFGLAAERLHFLDPQFEPLQQLVWIDEGTSLERFKTGAAVVPRQVSADRRNPQDFESMDSSSTSSSPSPCSWLRTQLGHTPSACPSRWEVELYGHHFDRTPLVEKLAGELGDVLDGRRDHPADAGSRGLAIPVRHRVGGYPNSPLDGIEAGLSETVEGLHHAAGACVNQNASCHGTRGKAIGELAESGS